MLDFVVKSLLVTLISKLSLSVSLLSALVFNELKSVFSTKSFATLLLNLATSVVVYLILEYLTYQLQFLKQIN